MPTINSFNNEVLAANVTFNGGTFSAGTDATDNAISIGTAANAGRTVTIGSGTAASSTVINCGTGALNIGANAIAKTTTLGATTGASVLALKYGTGDFTLASATGTVMSALDTGEITYPLQPAFLVTPNGNLLDKTGDGTAYTVVFATEIFDQSNDFDGTSTFTAPITGRYFLSIVMNTYNLLAGHNSQELIISTSNRGYTSKVNAINCAGGGGLGLSFSSICDMDAGDTAAISIAISGSTKTADISALSYFSGHLVC